MEMIIQLFHILDVMKKSYLFLDSSLDGKIYFVQCFFLDPEGVLHSLMSLERDYLWCESQLLPAYSRTAPPCWGC